MADRNPDPLSMIFYAVLATVMVPYRLLKTAFRLLFWSTKKAKVLRAATQKKLTCRQGCPPMLADGSWTCQGCKASYVGWVWKACPVCKNIPAYVPCQTCGIAIVSPKNG